MFHANSNSLHEIVDDDKVETEVNTGDDAVSAEHNWSSYICHHTKSRNQFKAKNVDKVSMVKHRYRKKNKLSNKKVAAAYQKLLHPTESIS